MYIYIYIYIQKLYFQHNLKQALNIIRIGLHLLKNEFESTHERQY
jgi:hypothetical protein